MRNVASNVADRFFMLFCWDDLRCFPFDAALISVSFILCFACRFRLSERFSLLNHAVSTDRRNRRRWLPVNQEVRAGDESPLAAHQQFRYMGYFIRRTGSSCRALRKHVSVKITSGTVEFIDCQRGDYNAREMELMRAPLAPHLTASAMTRLTLQRFAIW